MGVMKRTSPVQTAIFGVLVLAALMACKKEESSSSTGTTSAASGESVGVPECDEYLDKYETCLKEKVPAVARPQLEQSFKQTRETYKNLAANPATKASMPQTCKQALETTKSAMSSYGCTW